ncbi:MAG: uncharacterized protein KVP18_003468 [Porospora cf. gigantea A]|uniref:uncharacterized protein n=1 Tax=Porospora cf. gigantea A TaxID=2853593 RepID=UPI00355ACB83|nr:MAG: hypothetical protein KVP18_003468 [Porospora cf. gigantea A]
MLSLPLVTLGEFGDISKHRPPSGDIRRFACKLKDISLELLEEVDSAVFLQFDVGHAVEEFYVQCGEREGSHLARVLHGDPGVCVRTASAKLERFGTAMLKPVYITPLGSQLGLQTSSPGHFEVRLPNVSLDSTGLRVSAWAIGSVNRLLGRTTLALSTVAEGSVRQALSLRGMDGREACGVGFAFFFEEVYDLLVVLGPAHFALQETALADKSSKSDSLFSTEDALLLGKLRSEDVPVHVAIEVNHPLTQKTIRCVESQTIEEHAFTFQEPKPILIRSGTVTDLKLTSLTVKLMKGKALVARGVCSLMSAIEALEVECPVSVLDATPLTGTPLEGVLVDGQEWAFQSSFYVPILPAVFQTIPYADRPRLNFFACEVRVAALNSLAVLPRFDQRVRVELIQGSYSADTSIPVVLPSPTVDHAQAEPARFTADHLASPFPDPLIVTLPITLPDLAGVWRPSEAEKHKLVKEGISLLLWLQGSVTSELVGWTRLSLMDIAQASPQQVNFSGALTPVVGNFSAPSIELDVNLVPSIAINLEASEGSSTPQSVPLRIRQTIDPSEAVLLPPDATRASLISKIAGKRLGKASIPSSAMVVMGDQVNLWSLIPTATAMSKALFVDTEHTVEAVTHLYQSLSLVKSCFGGVVNVQPPIMTLSRKQGSPIDAAVLWCSMVAPLLPDESQAVILLGTGFKGPALSSYALCYPGIVGVGLELVTPRLRVAGGTVTSSLPYIDASDAQTQLARSRVDMVLTQGAVYVTTGGSVPLLSGNEFWNFKNGDIWTAFTGVGPATEVTTGLTLLRTTSLTKLDRLTLQRGLEAQIMRTHSLNKVITEPLRDYLRTILAVYLEFVASWKIATDTDKPAWLAQMTYVRQFLLGKIPDMHRAELVFVDMDTSRTRATSELFARLPELMEGGVLIACVRLHTVAWLTLPVATALCLILTPLSVVEVSSLKTELI